MVIGLDIDDTITRHPEFFALMSQALVAAGHEVVIITFRDDREATQEDLESWGVAYTKLVTSSLEAHLEHGVDEWKGVVCSEHGVEVFFDDDPDVIRYVDSSVTTFLSVDPDRRNMNLPAVRQVG